MSRKILRYGIGSGILVLSVVCICIVLALYGNVFTRPYPQLLKKISWVLGRPEPGYNFGVVEAGHLYRSSLPDDRFMRFLNKKYGITRVICLRHGPLPYEQTARELNIDLHIFVWDSTAPPADPREVEKILALMRDKKYVVLVHCGAGSARTGYVCARYRILYQNWPLEKAEKEMNKYWHQDETIYDKVLQEEFDNR